MDRLLEVFRRFQERDVKYVVIGGIAAVMHGVPRATFDLDILIEATPDNAHRLLDALGAAGLGTAALTTVEALLAHEVTIFKDRVRIDVQTSTPGIDFESVWTRKLTVKFRGQDVHVLCREDLISSKRASGRPVDMDDVRSLESNPEGK
jgi:hypothetical protein